MDCKFNPELGVTDVTFCIGSNTALKDSEDSLVPDYLLRRRLMDAVRNGQVACDLSVFPKQFALRGEWTVEALTRALCEFERHRCQEYVNRLDTAQVTMACPDNRGYDRPGIVTVNTGEYL